LALALGVGGLAACGGSGGGGGDDPIAEAAALTNSAVSAVVTGGDDFAQAVTDLSDAARLDPNSEAARAFRDLATWLDFLKTTSSPGGTFQDLFTRAGYVNPAAGGSFWDFDLQETNHGQGRFKDSLPTADELRAFLVAQYLPRLQALADSLATISPGFEYVVDAGAGGRFFGELDPQDRIAYHLDYGDLMFARAAVLAHLSAVNVLTAYRTNAAQLNDVDHFDHPGARPIDVIHADYPTLGTVEVAGRLAQARSLDQQAWAAYLAASQHIRGEAGPAQEVGILTLGRGVFSGPAERQDTLDREASFRAQGGDISTHLSLDQPLLVTVGPDGRPIDPADQPSVNFFQAFEPENLRTLYFQTILDPFTGRRVLGVPGWTSFTAGMLTGGGVLQSIGGVAPGAGDLASAGYAVRLDAPPSGVKTIDGSFGDWSPGVNAAQIGGSPGVGSRLPSEVSTQLGVRSAANVPDVGDVYASISGNTLYVHVDEDLAVHVDGPGDYYSILVEGPSGTAEVSYAFGSVHVGSASAPALTPDFAFAPGGGIEVRFPDIGSAGGTARVTVRVVSNTPPGVFDSERTDMFVRFP